MEPATKQILKGLAVSNLFALVLIGFSKLALTIRGETIFIFSEFVIIPVLMGIICSWYWKSLALPGRKRALYSLCNSFMIIFLSFIFLGEGVICLIIVSPLIFSFITLGAYLGYRMFKNNNDTLNVSVVALLLFVFISDSLSTHQYKNEVSDTVIINAPVNKVWKNVVAFKRIEQKNTYWLFNIGLPSPVESTVTGYYKGAGRKCIFSNGYTFGEKIMTYDENKDLTFDIIDQPRDPEIMNHIDILRGQFLLKDNGNNTTTLTGNSWYKLYVFPVWYYDMWAQSITRNVHVRVMAHIKDLSENE